MPVVKKSAPPRSRPLLAFSKIALSYDCDLDGHENHQGNEGRPNGYNHLGDVVIGRVERLKIVSYNPEVSPVVRDDQRQCRKCCSSNEGGDLIEVHCPLFTCGRA